MHSKITHIGFKTGGNNAVVSTGNFHEGNASRYTDVMLMTANRNIVQDVERVFGQLIDSRSFNIGTLRLLSGATSQADWEVINELAERAL